MNLQDASRVPAKMARLKRLILRLLNDHRVMTIATNRPDGWPQATMVGYVNDGSISTCTSTVFAIAGTAMARDKIQPP